jgi:hypothetical protein
VTYVNDLQVTNCVAANNNQDGFYLGAVTNATLWACNGNTNGRYGALVVISGTVGMSFTTLNGNTVYGGFASGSGGLLWRWNSAVGNGTDNWKYTDSQFIPEPYSGIGVSSLSAGSVR